MQQYLDTAHFVHGHNLKYEFIAGHVLICGQIACLGNILISVEKALEVLDPHAPALDARVQTVEYSYNAAVRKQGTFLRYDNQHAHKGHGDRHHRHDIDWSTDEEKPGSPSWMGEDRWPTLSDFIDEVADWYAQNHASLPEPNSIAALDEPYRRRMFGWLDDDDDC